LALGTKKLGTKILPRSVFYFFWIFEKIEMDFLGLKISNSYDLKGTYRNLPLKAKMNPTKTAKRVGGKKKIILAEEKVETKVEEVEVEVESEEVESEAEEYETYGDFCVAKIIEGRKDVIDELEKEKEELETDEGYVELKAKILEMEEQLNALKADCREQFEKEIERLEDKIDDLTSIGSITKEERLKRAMSDLTNPETDEIFGISEVQSYILSLASEVPKVEKKRVPKAKKETKVNDERTKGLRVKKSGQVILCPYGCGRPRSSLEALKSHCIKGFVGARGASGNCRKMNLKLKNGEEIMDEEEIEEYWSEEMKKL